MITHPILPVGRSSIWKADMNQYVDDRPAEGIFRVHRDVYADKELFELENKYIFERTWNFLGFESQLPNPHDFITAHIGRAPILVARGPDREVRAFLNICRHKGATLCARMQGNAKVHACPYHGWVFDSGGKNVHIKERDKGAYTSGFDTEDHDLRPLARVASYKGLIFGSLSAEVPTLEDYLGDTRFFIDLAMDQSPLGMEVIPGRAVYTYRGNWKLQMDNGVDPYHLTTAHLSFMEVMKRRRTGAGHQEGHMTDLFKTFSDDSTAFGFPHGHTVFAAGNPDPRQRPFYAELDSLRERVGELKADWMTHHIYNAQIFPNFQIAHNVALIVRTFRPISVDLTEMHSYCLGAIGESADKRAWRLRAFEDFYNSSGLATPDDTAVYERCQEGFATESSGWMQGYFRGMANLHQGPDAMSKELGLNPVNVAQGTMKTGDEVLLHSPYREWSRLMDAGRRGAKAYP